MAATAGIARPPVTHRHNRRHRRQQRPTQIARWLAEHEQRWFAHVKRLHRRLPLDAPVRDDIRFWEARVAHIDINDFSAFLWFFALHPISRFELCRQYRAFGHTDRIILRSDRRRLPYSAAAAQRRFQRIG